MWRLKKSSMYNFSQIPFFMSHVTLFFFGWVIIYAGAEARTPELKVTKETGYHLGQQAQVVM